MSWWSEYYSRRALLILSVAVIIAAGLVLLGVHPGLIALIGIGVWIFIFIAQGGFVEGNPYKRMYYSSYADFIEVKEYMRNAEEETSDSASTSTTVFFFIIGCIFLFAALVSYLFGLG